MSRRSRKPKLPNYPVRVTVESMTHDGRGVAHVEGKAVFIDGALPGEELSFLYTGRSRKHDEGRLCLATQVHKQVKLETPIIFRFPIRLLVSLGGRSS